MSHRAELEGQLQILPSKPHLVCLNETFLDDAVEHIKLGGYSLMSRRDRDDGREGGGIAVFALDIVSPQVVLLEHSKEFERSWHTIHTDIGPVLCCVWYRPPCVGEVQSIRACDEEWERLVENHVATIIIGDLNVHHTRWLRHSSAVSVEGTSMLRFCLARGLKQQVKQPTRELYLLDLVISDLVATNIEILPRISDHNMVLAEFDLGVPSAVVLRRTVFDFGKADWDSIRLDFRNHGWSPMDSICVDDAERYLYNRIMDTVRSHTPEKDICERRSAHPWVNGRCLTAIREKNDADVNSRAEAAARCSDVLFEEYCAYTQRMRDKLKKAKRGSKLWWKLTNNIMDKAGKTSSIPALKSTNGWVLDAGGKSELFAKTFSSKFGIPEIVVNEYSALPPAHHRQGYVPMRSRQVEKVLCSLDENSGTGPDGLATRILKFCSEELSLPLAKLLRRILAESFWPTAWVVHWLMPLYKRKSVFDPLNYRAINLTAQISKAAERALCPHFVPALEERAFGVSQFAYRKKHGARDAIAVYVLSWIESLNRGSKTGVYCSDVSGAVDRVSAERLMEKLSCFNLNPQM